MRWLVLGLVLSAGCAEEGGRRQPETTTGEVVQVLFTAGQSNLGYQFGRNGGPVWTSTSDQYHLLVKTPDGQQHVIEVTKEEWSGCKTGGQVNLYKSFGKWKIY